MKRVLSCAIIMLLSFGVQAQSKEKIEDLKNDAEEAKKMMLSENDGLKKFFDTSAGYVIFPNVGKGGLIVGGASGTGIVYEKGEAVGSARLTEVNVGLQAGGQAVVETIFFETKNALAKFKESNFNFAAGASAVVLKSGESINAQYTDGVAVFTYSKGGLMAEASVGGQKFKYKPFRGK